MAAPTVADRNRPGRPGASTLYLVVMGPHGSATHQLPERGTVVIGRAEDAPVRLVDPLASRSHAHLHVGPDGIEIEDLNSANGTRVREGEIAPGTRAAVSPGEAITIGSTILLLQSRTPSLQARQVWPHAFFETRLIEECARAQSLRGTFALVRLRLDSEAAAARAGEAIAAALRPGDVLATYGPREYEILLVDSDRPQSQVLLDEVRRALAAQGLALSSSLAFFPTDGTSPQALVARASALMLGLGGDAPAAAGPGVVIRNARVRALYEVAERAAAGTINVLITGETGSGKEVLAETIHKKSPRAARPFVVLNCAALPESLLESELFGHEKGSFTGALQTKVGLLEAASGGSLFLDEVGEMPLVMQAKLLRALESRQVMRVGATRTTPVDVRFIAATNRDLEEEVAAKTFRQDLYFRLAGICLDLPPLRERTDEIEPIASLCLETVARQLGRDVPVLSAEALELLRGYSWPGNIRELRNAIERAVLLCTGGAITAEHLPSQKVRQAEQALGEVESEPAAEPGDAAQSPRLRDQKEALERQAIIDALARCAGSQTRAAELLGISRRTLCARIKQYNIPRPRV